MVHRYINKQRKLYGARMRDSRATRIYGIGRFGKTASSIGSYINSGESFRGLRRHAFSTGRRSMFVNYPNGRSTYNRRKRTMRYVYGRKGIQGTRR